MPEYQLDFDQVAQVGRATRHRPTFPLRQLDFAINREAASSYTVQQNQRHHHGEWYLPLYEAHVRAWLKKQYFTQPPLISAGGVEVTCALEVPPLDAETAQWEQHYRASFTQPALEQELSEIEGDRREFSYGKEGEWLPRRAALRRILGRAAPA